MRKLLVLSLLVSLLGLGTAFAQDDAAAVVDVVQAADSYVGGGVNLTFGRVSVSTPGFAAGGGATVFGVKGFYGLRDFISQDFDARASLSLGFGDATIILLGADAIYGYPLSSDIEIYGGAGPRLGFISPDGISGGFNLGLGLVGGGVYSLSEQLSLLAEFGFDLNIIRPGETFDNNVEASWGTFAPGITIGALYNIP